MLKYCNPSPFRRYETLDASTEDLERPYTALASLLNCHPDEIAVVTSATEAWQQVIYGLAAGFSAGDVILTSLCEYGSNYISYLHLQKRNGIEIAVIPETKEGDLDLQALENLLRGTTSSAILEEGQPADASLGHISSSSKPRKIVLVTLNHVPTSSGRVYDVEGVGALTKHYNVPFLLDACQSVGQLPVDVAKIGCDFLSGTGRKYLRGPRGSGFLYCSRSALQILNFEPATLDNTGAGWTARDAYQLRPNAKRFERYEMSFAAKVGLGVAIQQCNEVGIEAIWERIQYLAIQLRNQLSQIPGITVQDKGAQLCGLVSFTKVGLIADHVQKELFKQGINTSVSRVLSSRLDFEDRGLQDVVRASVHYYNTEEEIYRLIEVVKEL